ncbi:uncharacterized protein LOC124376818 isoform X2 [Silurus meridionalis]|uniref:uncharacterized protein LOC124376818 isoform X2 n=1 Tax=Silurus meridionalis TaxID=175797 RepID=UPI001EEB7776|nr:uncharacterized protein LOC124376818 isoform X2 [Silurus meridionalis]
MEIPDQGTNHVTSPSKDCKRKRKRSHSAEPSCVFMKSDMDHPYNFRNENPSPVHSKRKRKRSHSPEPSCVSMKSDRSMEPPANFRTGISSPVHSVLQKAGDRREKNIITATGIRCSGITGRSGEALTSVLNSETSSLRELHLTVNKLDLSE